MGEIRDEIKYPLVVVGGLVTGFVSSVVAGRVDLRKGEGWKRAFIGAGGSAFHGGSIFGITKAAGGSDQLGLALTGGWFAFQTLASVTNGLGSRFKWQEKQAYQAVAIPLNLAATPAVSTVGLLWGGFGMAANGFKGDVHVYAGMVVFEHKLCMTALNMGVAAHCIKSRGADPNHEWGHQIQFSIMGELGFLTVAFIDFLTYPPASIGHGTGGRTLEPWAKDFRQLSLDPVVFRGPPFHKPDQERKKRHKNNSKNHELKVLSDNRNVSKKITGE